MQPSLRHPGQMPDIPHDGPLTVMDATCALCARGARWIARNDAANEFRIVPLQSELGRTVMVAHGLDPDDPESWLFRDETGAYEGIDAMIRTGQRLGGRWKMLTALRVLPPPLLRWIYARIARNRYRIMGRTDLCALPDPAVQERLIQ